MSRFYGGLKIIARHYGLKVISTAYKGARLIWQLLKSCFGGGFWNNKQPWDNKGGWRNL